MGHPDEMENERVRWQPNTTLPIRPPQELIAIMFKDGCSEDTLLAVTDRTGHHTIVTPDTRRKSI